MTVSFTGDWTKILSNLHKAVNEIENDSQKKLRKNAAKVERKVLDHIDAQDLEWEELNAKYALRKEKKGLDPDILRASNAMYSNITTATHGPYIAAVGVQRGVKTKDGEEVTDIAIIHEQPDDDGKKIPARKLWKPVFEEMEEKAGLSLMDVGIKIFK